MAPKLGESMETGLRSIVVAELSNDKMQAESKGGVGRRGREGKGKRTGSNPRRNGKGEGTGQRCH